jgi:PTH1 family peptidyl-tRNA hydrolase
VSEGSTSTLTLIVGLGNPGEKYAGTRHNAGFLVANELARRWAIDFDKKRFQGRFGEGRFDGRKVAILKPQTFMNLSGQAVIEAMNFYRLTVADLFVAVDDLALPVGRVRLRANGSAGGQKGLADIIQRIGSDAFARVRVGIGATPTRMDAAEYVLSRFSDSEKPLIDAAVKRAADAIETAMQLGVERAMERFNRPEKSEGEKKRPARDGGDASDSTTDVDNKKNRKDDSDGPTCVA